MRIRNNYSEKIHWRAFGPNDTVYMVGLHQQAVEKEKMGDWVDDSFPEIKVEVKTGDIVFSSRVLARADKKFKMTDDLLVNSDGSLSVAVLNFEESGAAEFMKRRGVQFFDARRFNEPTTRTITFSLQNSVSLSEGQQQSQEHEQTWSVQGNIGGKVGKGKAKGEISVGFVDRVVNAMQSRYEKQVTSVWSQSISDTFTFKPGLLYAIEVVWRLEAKKGFVSYFGEKTSYEVVSRVHGDLTTPSAFKTVEEMPDALRALYEALRDPPAAS